MYRTLGEPLTTSQQLSACSYYLLKLSRDESDRYLDGRPPGKSDVAAGRVLVRPAGCAHPVSPNAPVEINKSRKSGFQLAKSQWGSQLRFTAPTRPNKSAIRRHFKKKSVLFTHPDVPSMYVFLSSLECVTYILKNVAAQIFSVHFVHFHYMDRKCIYLLTNILQNTFVMFCRK